MHEISLTEEARRLHEGEGSSQIRTRTPWHRLAVEVRIDYLEAAALARAHRRSLPARAERDGGTVSKPAPMQVLANAG